MPINIQRGSVVWAQLSPVKGREQAGRRPAVVVASEQYLRQADTLAIVVPATTRNRNWPNHVLLRGAGLKLDHSTFAMTEQPRTISRERLSGNLGSVDTSTLREIDVWLRDFLGLP